MKLNLVRNLFEFYNLSNLRYIRSCATYLQANDNFSANIKGKVLPLMYTLLPNKTERIYLKLFKMFDDIPNFSPKEITVVFEMGVINALLKVWPSINISLCWFHYCQSLWRNIQIKKLVTDYNSDELVRKLFIYLKFLPFVPPKDVIISFNKIKLLGNSCRKFNPMFSYFETYYIGKLKKNSLNIRKLPPFPILRWNEHSRVLYGKTRTSNSQESWHNAFLTDARVHQTLNKLIESFRKE